MQEKNVGGKQIYGREDDHTYSLNGARVCSKQRLG